MRTIGGIKGAAFAVIAAVGFAVHGAWVVDTTAKTLVDKESGWGFNITIANTTDITLKSTIGSYANTGDLNLYGMPGDYAVVDVGTVLKSTGITSLREPDSITVIRSVAFCGCMTITNITGFGGVTTVEEKDNFYNAKNLTGRITIPNANRITQWMFHDTKVQEVVALNATVWNEGAFDSSSITNIVYDPEKLITIYNAPRLAMKGDLVFPNATTVGGFGSSSITSINLPKVKTLSGGVFNGCTSLTNFIGGLELETLTFKDVFWNCPKLTGTITWPKLKVLHGNTFTGTNVKSMDLSSLETFSTQYATGGWLTSAITNLVLGPVTAIPETGIANSNPAVPQQVHFLGPTVPTFAGKAFDNPDSKICRFYIHDMAALPSWTAACMQRKSKGGDYGKYFYNDQGQQLCPRRTIGLVNATGHVPNGWGYAYAINATEGGMAIRMK